MNQKENELINTFFNVLEFSHSNRSRDDLWWLYFGLMNDSVMFNIVEYLLTRFGLIKN